MEGWRPSTSRADGRERVSGDDERAMSRRIVARVRTLILSVVALVVAVPHSSTAQSKHSAADSISDREFWRLFTTMSEESGSFPSENFVSNEKTYQYVIPTLQRTLTPNGVYLGVGPEQNFTYIVNLEPRMAVIFDIRRQNAMLHLMYKALFELSPSRAEFVARLFSRPLPLLAPSATAAEIFAAAAVTPRNDSAFDATNQAILDRLMIRHGFALSDSDVVSIRRVFQTFFVAGPDISYAYRLGAPPPSVTPFQVTFAQIQTLTNADSVNMAFLATEENYRRIRSLEARNMVVPVVGDFAGPKAIRAVGDYLRQRGAVVTAFYTSNVEQYLFGGFGADKRFYRNVETLPIDSTSTFIRAVPVGVGVPVPGNPVLSAPPNASVRSTDSAAVRIVTISSIDSTGKTVTTVLRMDLPPPSTVGAFSSGIGRIRSALDAFVNGQLDAYQQLVALTKTEGWQQTAKPSPPPSPAIRIERR